MKKLLIIILLSITGLQLDAMQQAPDRVPSLLNLAQKELVNESLKGKLSKEDLEKLPEELRVPLQEKIKQGAINQGKPVRSYETKVGKVTVFTNGSKRIDNYLGIGDTLYLSQDLDRYLQTDASGNVRINSLDKRVTFKSPQAEISVFPHDIESTYEPYKTGIDIRDDYITIPGPFLDLDYPRDFSVSFEARSKNIEARPASNINSSTLLSLHKAITHLNKNDVDLILRNLTPRKKQDLLNYLLVTDNALQRAVKKALSATPGKQFDDAKAIVKMLILEGADINKPNIDGKTALQLAANNPELLSIIQQNPAREKLLTAITPLRKELLIAIDQGNKAQVDNIFAIATKQNALNELLTIDNGGEDTPLVKALKRALETPDKAQFKRYIDIAQLLITNGATLNNPSGKAFISDPRYGKEYRAKLAPYLKI